MGVFGEGRGKFFLLGNISGVILTIVTIVVLLVMFGDLDEVLDGEFENLYVETVESPGEYYDRSLNVYCDGERLARFGKRSTAENVDRCQLFDPEGNLVVHFAVEDEEVGPGVLLAHDGRKIATFGFADSSEGGGSLEEFRYGWPESNVKTKKGDIGYEDIDVDGQFDIKIIFDGDGEIFKTFIFYGGDWDEGVLIDSEDGKAVIFRDLESMYRFETGHGWQLAEALEEEKESS